MPLLTLAGLWTYSTYASVGDARALLQVADTYRYYGGPTGDLDLALQAERRAAVVHTASARHHRGRSRPRWRRGPTSAWPCCARAAVAVSGG